MFLHSKWDEVRPQDSILVFLLVRLLAELIPEMDAGVTDPLPGGVRTTLQLLFCGQLSSAALSYPDVLAS